MTLHMNHSAQLATFGTRSLQGFKHAHNLHYEHSIAMLLPPYGEMCFRCTHGQQHSHHVFLDFFQEVQSQRPSAHVCLNVQKTSNPRAGHLLVDAASAAQQYFAMDRVFVRYGTYEQQVQYIEPTYQNEYKISTQTNGRHRRSTTLITIRCRSYGIW